MQDVYLSPPVNLPSSPLEHRARMRGMRGDLRGRTGRWRETKGTKKKNQKTRKEKKKNAKANLLIFLRR